MNLRHMEVFRAVYHAKTVSGAARMLGVSQPSVSRMLHHFEHRLGYKLFRRRKGRLVPTGEAERMIGEIDRVFEAVGRVDRIATLLRKGSTNRVAIVAITSIAVGILPAVLREIAKRHPNSTISLNAQNFQDQINAITKSEADIGIATNVPPLPGLERRLLGNARFVAVVHKEHACADKRRIGLVDLRRWPSIISPEDSPLGNVIHWECRARGIVPKIAAVTKSPILTAGLIQAFEGIGLLDCLTARLINNDKLAVKPLEEVINFSIHAFWRADAPLSQPHLRVLELTERQLSSIDNQSCSNS